jgi:hypothetical protein
MRGGGANAKGGDLFVTVNTECIIAQYGSSTVQ